MVVMVKMVTPMYILSKLNKKGKHLLCAASLDRQAPFSLQEN